MTIIPQRYCAALLVSIALHCPLGAANAESGEVTEVIPQRVRVIEIPVSTDVPVTRVHAQEPIIVAPPTVVLHGEDDVRLAIAEALELALTNHPGIAALDKEYWALDSIAWQESRKPNPGLELEFGDFGGTADNKGIKALGTSLTYSQSIERGGKRTKREVAASLEREVVLWDIAELEHEIQADVRVAFAAAQAAQYEADQLLNYRALVQRIADVISMNVEAGRSARLELDRFQLELAMLDLQLEIAGRNREQAYLELAGTWGSTDVEFVAVELVEADRSDVPVLDDLLPLVYDHPAYTRFDAEYEALCALVDLENANAVTDFELFGGLTRLNETEETVFTVGVGWELKTNDKNEGNISSAAYMLEQVADNQSLALLELETELTSLHRLAGSALLNFKAYGDKLIPAANNAMALTEEGYRYGKFELMDVLDAQRTVLEMESEQTAALMEFHLLIADIEALLNVDLNAFTDAEASVEISDDNVNIQTEENLQLEEEQDNE